MGDSGPRIDHPFKPSFSGMVCEQMVMRNGGGDQCGESPQRHHKFIELKEGLRVLINGVGYVVQDVRQNGKFSNYVEGWETMSVVVYTKRRFASQKETNGG